MIEDVELRWAVPPNTTAESRVLQYRRRHSEGGWTDWESVPVVVVLVRRPLRETAMTDTNRAATIAELMGVLQAVTADLEEALERERAARAETTACLNRVNEAQKLVDAVIAEVRKAAPRTTNWGKERINGLANTAVEEE